MKFIYSARKGPENLEKGVIEADTEPSAITKLIDMGFSPISVYPETESVKGVVRPTLRFKNIKNRDLTTFTSQLSVLLESGLTLYKALTVLYEQTENKNLQSLIKDIIGLVREGKSFSEALKQYPRVFSDMYTSMVKAGEISGTLEEVLKRLADFGEKQEEILTEVHSAMAYPVLMIIVGLATIISLFSFVIPKLVDLFESIGQVLPLPTKMLINFSDFLLDFWWLIVAVLSFIVFSVRRGLLTSGGRMTFDRLKLSFPIVGKFFKIVYIANFSRTLGMLLANGVNILQAMECASEASQSEALKRELKKISGEIKEGSSLAKGVLKSKYFPVFVVNLIAIGEESGELANSLIKIADAYEREARKSVKLLTSLIEPVMILVMGSIVGFIVISMLLPIFQISLIAK